MNPLIAFLTKFFPCIFYQNSVEKISPFFLKVAPMLISCADNAMEYAYVSYKILENRKNCLIFEAKENTSTLVYYMNIYDLNITKILNH